MYQNGELPFRIDLLEGDEGKRPEGGRTIYWKTPPKEIELEKLLPVLVEGLREKRDAQLFLA